MPSYELCEIVLDVAAIAPVSPIKYMPTSLPVRVFEEMVAPLLSWVRMPVDEN
jgi:hypothetical protein